MQNAQNINQGPPKRLYRSKVNRMISGVCGGLGEYLNMDPVVVRIVFILLALFGGGGIILYLIGIIVIPENPNQNIVKNQKIKSKSNHSAFWGWVLIIIGALLLIPQFTFVPPMNLWDLPWGVIWAVLFILIGLFFLLKTTPEENAQQIPNNEPAAQKQNQSQQSNDEFTEQGKAQPDAKHLYRSRTDRMISGVCGGLAEYFDMDPTVVRLIFVFLTIFSKGLGVLAYIILIFAMPDEKPQIFSDGEQS